jgi:hypothetical protein
MISATLPISHLRLHGGNSGAGSMPEGTSISPMAPALQRLSAWVLNRPLPPELLVQHFRWCRRDGCLAVRAQLRCRERGSVQLLT